MNMNRPLWEKKISETGCRVCRANHPHVNYVGDNPVMLLPTIDNRHDWNLTEEELDLCVKLKKHITHQGFSDSEIDAIHFKHNSDLRLIDSALDTISSFLCQQRQISAEQFFTANVVYRELLTNAIRHGNQACTEKQVLVSLFYIRSVNTLRISVIDQGTGYDFHNMLKCIKNEDELRQKHRGLFIIEQLCNKVHCAPGLTSVDIIL